MGYSSKCDGFIAVEQGLEVMLLVLERLCSMQ